MGRDLWWYTLAAKLEHKGGAEKVCLSLESNCYDVVTREICERFPQDDYGDFEIEKCCPKCLLFLGEFRESSLVPTTFHVGYSYSNPLWNSKWNVYHIMSKSKTDITLQFPSTPLLFEVTMDDFLSTEAKLQEMGTPCGEGIEAQYDLEAYEESMSVLAFIRSSLSQEGLRVLYKSEM